MVKPSYFDLNSSNCSVSCRCCICGAGGFRLLDGTPGYKFVDPDGLFAEPAYDLGILMRGWNEELLAGDTLALGRARCAMLAELTGVDGEAIWQWGFIERVSTGLLLTQLGLPDARDTLAIAERWVAG